MFFGTDEKFYQRIPTQLHFHKYLRREKKCFANLKFLFRHYEIFNRKKLFLIFAKGNKAGFDSSGHTSGYFRNGRFDEFIELECVFHSTWFF